MTQKQKTSNSLSTKSLKVIQSMVKDYFQLELYERKIFISMLNERISRPQNRQQKRTTHSVSNPCESKGQDRFNIPQSQFSRSQTPTKNSSLQTNKKQISTATTISQSSIQSFIDKKVTQKITQMLEYVRNNEKNKLSRGFSEQNKNVSNKSSLETFRSYNYKQSYNYLSNLQSLGRKSQQEKGQKQPQSDPTIASLFSRPIINDKPLINTLQQIQFQQPTSQLIAPQQQTITNNTFKAQDNSSINNVSIGNTTQINNHDNRVIQNTNNTTIVQEQQQQQQYQQQEQQSNGDVSDKEQLQHRNRYLNEKGQYELLKQQEKLIMGYQHKQIRKFKKQGQQQKMDVNQAEDDDDSYYSDQDDDNNQNFEHPQRHQSDQHHEHQENYKKYHQEQQQQIYFQLQRRHQRQNLLQQQQKVYRQMLFNQQHKYRQQTIKQKRQNYMQKEKQRQCFYEDDNDYQQQDLRGNEQEGNNWHDQSD